VFTQRILTDHTFNFRATVESHGWRNLAPFSDDGHILRYVHRMHDGRIIQLNIQADGNTSRESFLLLQTEGDVYPSDLPEIDTAVRFMLQMDADLSAFYAYVTGLPDYTWVAPSGAGRLLRAPTVWENLAKMVLTTNITWNQTVEMVARLVTLGDESDYGHAFPTPQQIASMDADDFADHIRAGYRAAYLHTLARQITSGAVNVEAWGVQQMSSEALYKEIKALKGFGDYAASSIVRLLGHHDVISIDSIAREVFKHLHNNDEKATDSEIRAYYARHGQWQGLVMWMDVIRHHGATREK